MVQSLVQVCPSCDHFLAILGSTGYLHKKRCECMAEMGRGCTFILQNAYPGPAMIRKPACVQAGFFNKKMELLLFLGQRFAESSPSSTCDLYDTSICSICTYSLQCTCRSLSSQSSGRTGTNCNNGTLTVPHSTHLVPH